MWGIVECFLQGGVMNKRDIIHLIICSEIKRDTKTGCGELLSDCGSGVTYEFKQAVTCPVCQSKVNRIARMRNEKEIEYAQH
jgi:hypothetical protein